jgi:hypothetical protein
MTMIGVETFLGELKTIVGLSVRSNVSQGFVIKALKHMNRRKLLVLLITQKISETLITSKNFKILIT